MRRALPCLLACLLAALPSVARAYAYFTPDQVLESFFGGVPAAEVVFTPTPDQRAHLRQVLGYDLPKPTYTLYDAGTGTTAVFDQQLGQHEPIDFAVLLDAEAHVLRVEILVYREAYGDGVRGDAFRKQFIGLGPQAPMRPGKDIRIVSGATISTRSIATGVKRAAALVQTALGLQ